MKNNKGDLLIPILGNRLKAEALHLASILLLKRLHDKSRQTYRSSGALSISWKGGPLCGLSRTDGQWLTVSF